MAILQPKVSSIKIQKVIASTLIAIIAAAPAGKNDQKSAVSMIAYADFLLQVVLQKGFKNIADLAKTAVNTHIRKENYIKIPVIHSHSEKNNTHQKT